MKLTEAQKLLITKLGQEGVKATSLSIEERQNAELLGKFGAVILRWKGLGENRYAATPLGLKAIADGLAFVIVNDIDTRTTENRTVWKPIEDFNLEEYDRCFLGHDGSNGEHAYSSLGWFRRNRVSGDGYRTGEGEWLIPQPTHFMPLELPPAPAK